jgi:hypothetical protein
MASLQTTRQISMKFGIESLYLKSFGDLNFGSYRPNITPALHEDCIETWLVLEKWLLKSWNIDLIKI